VILSAYTVYLDLWLCSVDGRVLAHGRPDRYGRVRGADVAHEAWFRDALATRSGEEYVVADIAPSAPLDGALVATYAAAVRQDGEADGRILGILGIHFDWAPQAAAVVKGVRLSAEEAERSRVLLVDGEDRVIAASDGAGVLSETFPLRTAETSGSRREANGHLVAFHRTPGYETYRGLGWRGVITQAPARNHS
jgi:hypothetical protein